MERRLLLRLAAALPAWAVPLRTQTQGQAGPRIGVQSVGVAPSGSDSDPIKGFRQALREWGHDEGRGLVFEYRCADAQDERLAELAAAQVAAQVALRLDVSLARSVQCHPQAHRVMR